MKSPIERSQQDTHVCVNILHKLMRMDIPNEVPTTDQQRNELIQVKLGEPMS